MTTDENEHQVLRDEIAALRDKIIRLEAEILRRGNIISELQWRSSSSLGGVIADFKPPGSRPYIDGFGRR